MSKRTGSLLRRLNLQHRMMVWFAAIILILLACVFVFLHVLVTNDMRSQVVDGLGTTRRLVDIYHKTRGDDLLAQCSLFASLAKLSSAVLHSSEEDVAAQVNEYAPLLGSADYVLVTGPGRRVLASWKIRAKVPDLDLVKPMLNTLKGKGSENPTVVATPKAVFQFAACEIRGPGASLAGGPTIGAVAMAKLIDSDHAGRLQMMSGADITFFSGNPLPGAQPPRLVASSLTDEDRRLLAERFIETPARLNAPATVGQSDPYLVTMGGTQQYLTVTAAIRRGDKSPLAPYIIQRRLQEVMVPVQNMQRSLLLVGLIAMLVGVAASYIVSNGVGRRVLKVVRAAEALSAGDWAQRVPDDGPNDLRILAEAFNRMASRLQGWDAELRAEVALRTEELNQAMARLDANLRQMRQFHADASHELRTPLTIMRGEVEVALRTVRSPEEYQRVLHSILEEMNRVSAIVGHLLLLARADSGQVQLAREDVSLNGLLQDLHEQAVLLARPKDLQVHLDAEEDVTVVGDSGKLRQLILNLIDNAIKYTPDKGSAWLRVFTDNGFAAVSVRDTGIGIAQTDIPHIFDRFFRADRARSREMGGAGLGLAICQWIIDAHHGWIDVQSTVGQGTTFTVYIPRVTGGHT